MSVLYNSGVEKTKHFFKGGTFFGWKTIERLWEREVERSQKGQMVTIPRMKSRYIYRDSWTRLNVTPAKIMQVCAHYPYVEYQLILMCKCMHVLHVCPWILSVRLFTYIYNVHM